MAKFCHGFACGGPGTAAPAQASGPPVQAGGCRCARRPLPRLVESGNSFPMHRVLSIICPFFVIVACGNPHDGPRAHWTGPEPRSQPDSDSTSDHPEPSSTHNVGNGTVAVAYTFEDWAKKLGVHLDIFMLASMGCTRLLNCGWDVGIPSECAAAMVRVWCEDYSCSEAIFDAPYQFRGHECTLDTLDPEACDSINEPLQCEFLQGRGLVFRITDGAPLGGWPVNTLFDRGPLPEKWPRSAQSQPLPKSHDAPK